MVRGVSISGSTLMVQVRGLHGVTTVNPGTLGSVLIRRNAVQNVEPWVMIRKIADSLEMFVGIVRRRDTELVNVQRQRSQRGLGQG